MWRCPSDPTDSHFPGGSDGSRPFRPGRTGKTPSFVTSPLPAGLARALSQTPRKKIRAGNWLGKYKLRTRLASGGFADVYVAQDSILNIPVAVKIPNAIAEATPEDFLKEIQMMARLDHPNILPIKNADIIDGHLVVVYPLGERSLDDRLGKRISLSNALDYAEQLLAGLAHAHAHRIVHCDVKPGNLILFSDGSLKLADFGIAKLYVRTIYGSSSGTLGYMAPEHAMGRPSMRSDVFSAGLVIYRMLAGHLPEWPFDWPPEGHARLKKYGPELGDLLRRAIEVRASKRFRDADEMLTALVRVKASVLQRDARRRARERKARSAK